MIARFLTMLVWVFALLASAPPAVSPAPPRALPRGSSRARGARPTGCRRTPSPRSSRRATAISGSGPSAVSCASTATRSPSSIPATRPGLASARIVALHEDPSGILWIGTEAGLSRLRAAGASPAMPTRDGLRRRRVRMHRTGAGGSGSGTDSGLKRFDGRGVRRVRGPSLRWVGRLSLAETPDGDVWVGDVARRLTRSSTGTAGAVGRHGQPDGSVRSPVRRLGGAGCGSGASTRCGAGTAHGSSRSRCRRTVISAARIHRMADDRDGNLWLGTTARTASTAGATATIDVYNTAATA